MLPGKLLLVRYDSKVEFEYVLTKLGQKRRKQDKFSAVVKLFILLLISTISETISLL